jgi:hypothetical protein
MNEQVINVLSKKWVIPATVGVASFGGGLVAGYIWGKRNGKVSVISFADNDLDFLSEFEEETKHDPNQLEIEFDNGSTSMIPQHVVSRAEYAKMMSLERDIQVIEEEEEIPWELEEEAELLLEEDELEEAIAEQMHHEIVDNDEDNLPEVRNIFANQLDDDQWNYDDELSIRTPDLPYVISIDEFVADEGGCEQSTVTYYQGDDIMADQFDVPLYGFNEMMGDLKFGHGSNASDVVYIRNEKLGLEWEVILNTGRFDIEVLGHDIEDVYEKAELKHSVPRFRDE